MSYTLAEGSSELIKPPCGGNTVTALILLLAIAFLSPVSWAAHPSFSDLAEDIHPSHLVADLKRLTALGSRVSGYPGNAQAADLIRAEFERVLGKANVDVQEFELPIPVDEGAQLRVGNKTYELRCMWPNLVRTSQIAREGIKGEVIYVGAGLLRDYNDQNVEGSIVVVDFNSGQNWLNAPLLGAAAVIFVEPITTTRGEAETKFVSCPIDVPRFYISGDAAMALRAQIALGDNQGRLTARMPWRSRTNRNIIGFLDGSSPELRHEAIILEAYYDSISVVPSLAPGAESAAGITALLEIMRGLKAHPPARSVIFLATSGHFEALAGAREFVNLWGKEPRTASEADDRLSELGEYRQQLEKTLQQARVARRTIDEVSGRIEVVIDRFKVSETVRQTRERRLTHTIERVDHDLALLERIAHRYPQIHLFISLDLSTQNNDIGVFNCGWYYAQTHLLRFYSPLGKFLSELMEEEVGPALGLVSGEGFVDGINPVKGREWHTHFPGKIAFDHEMAIRGGRPGIVFATVNDARSLCDTPLDTLERIDFSSLTRQTKIIYCLLTVLLNDLRLEETALKRIKTLKKLDELKDVVGTVLEFRRKESFLPNTPVAHALVLAQGNYRMMMGVHTELMTMANELSEFTLRGEMVNRATQLEAYGLDPDSGDIIYAPDRGPDGDVKYPREIFGRAGLNRPIIVFPCAPLDLYDLVDERYFETLEQLFVYDASDYAEPISFGYSLSNQAASAAEFPSYSEPCAVVYALRDMRVDIAMGMGLLGLRMIAINASEKAPTGRGFSAQTTDAIRLTPLQVAQDMWLLNESRMKQLRRNGIQNRRLVQLHEYAELALQQAREALAERRYDEAIAAARHAWGFESRAYPDVMKTSEDVVKGVLFYLALLMPFAFFAERLFVHARSVNGQILWTCIMFAVVFLILSQVHPAFDLSTQPLIILLSFVIMALAVIVISLVTMKFNQQLKQMKQEESGVHEADVGRLSAAGAAFGLGVANMRRRKARTFLTAVTLVLLTFTVLSFTSVRSYLRANSIRLGHRPAYPGLMIRDRAWFPLEEPTAFIIRNELAQPGVRTVTPRTWYSSAQLDKQLYIDVTSVADPTKTYAANVLLGLAPQEAEVTGVDKVLVAGRWLQEGDRNVCVIPKAIATRLDIPLDRLSAAQVSIFGTPFRVIGVFDEQEFRKLVDLDGENLAPVDYAVMRPEILEEIKRQSEQRFRLGTGGAQSLLQEYKHFSPEVLVILPYSRVLELGGTLRSIAVRYHDPGLVAEEVNKLMNRFALSVYAGIDGMTYLYSSVALTSLAGLHTVGVPILIAALIVLNTMLGSVYERTREIFIYSSLGLAPAHISMLFIAEACVFANMGAILGYLIGQLLARMLFALNPEGRASALELNYSSLSAIGVTVIVMAVVLLSTIFPSKKASQLASPGIERKWKMPEPEGDYLRTSLPFTVTGRDALGVVAFLTEFFSEYVGYAGGEFLAEDVRLEPVTSKYGQGIAVRLRMWLAPYDLGVSQDFQLACLPTGESDIHSVELTLHRLAGDTNSWKKTNALFLSSLRKQFLIWRTVPVSQKGMYAERGQAIRDQATQSSGVPPTAPLPA
ncbi:MAG: FtsX-like permease family protein [Candidatus Zipacnadales bacterium]